MTLDLNTTPANRRMRRLVFVLGGLVALLVALVVFLVAVVGVGSGKNDDTGAPAPQQSTSATPEPAETVEDNGDGGYVEPQEWVALPAGKSTSNGLPVKFPHTPEGAAAMVVSSARNAWSLDPDQIRNGVEAYTDGEFRTAALKAVEDAALGNRRYAGVPDTGEIPDGATLNAWPIGVQWKAKDANTVDLLVLLRVVHSPGAGESETTELIVSSAQAVWTSGDWRNYPAEQSQSLPDPVEVGTEAFNDDGWKAIQEGDRR